MLTFLGIDLENIVYYKDNTHYFVMTAKKQSLLDKGVIINVSLANSNLRIVLMHQYLSFLYQLILPGTKQFE